MDLVHFSRTLRGLTADDIRVISCDLADLVSSPSEAVAATKAALAIDHAVQRAHRQPQAGLAAYSVSQCVLAAAERAGFVLPNDDVTRVARNAAAVARGCVAGPPASGAVAFLAGGFRHVLPTEAAAA
jgi:hypothetical protein